MAKVLYHVTMSLDGFIAGPGHSMAWLSQAELGPQSEGMAVPETLGAALAGRNGYDIGRHAGSELYGGAYRGPIFVLTHRPPGDETNPAYTFLSGDISAAVETALAAAGGKDLLVLGGTVAGQCLQANLLDEIFVHIAPVLLGDGIPLFRRSDLTVKLDLIGNTQEGGSANLRYAVRR